MSPCYLLLLVACTLCLTSATTTTNEMKAKLKEALEAGQEDRFNAIFGEDKASLAEAARLKDLSGQTAVHTACYNDDEQTLRVLREGKGDLSLTDDAGNNCFHLLAREGHEKLMVTLLQDKELFLSCRRRGSPQDCGVHYQNKKSVTPLMYAAGKGLVGVVSRILELESAQVNIPADDRRTAIFYAANNGHLSTVNLLLKHGALSTSKDKNGETALTDACKNGHENVATVLLEHLSSSADFFSYADQTLVWAVKNGMEKIAQELIEKGAKIDVRDEFSESLDLLLIVAANAKMDKVVSALLGKGADPNRRNNEKKKLTWWQWFLSFFYTMVNEGVARKVAESL